MELDSLHQRGSNTVLSHQLLGHYRPIPHSCTMFPAHKAFDRAVRVHNPQLRMPEIQVRRPSIGNPANATFYPNP